MMRTLADTLPSRPARAIDMALKAAGLSEVDFLVCDNTGRPGGTYVNLYTSEANARILDRAECIEKMTRDAGHPFHISVYSGCDDRLDGAVFVRAVRYGQDVLRGEEAYVLDRSGNRV